MNLKYSNNAFGRLAAPITASQTSFSLQAGQGDRFPALGANDYFTLTAVRPDTSLEIMYVTARSSDVLTVLRGQENTVALSFDGLTIVENRITAKSIMDEIGMARSIVNAALELFQPSVPIGIDQLRLMLLGALGPEQLTNELKGRIALIDGSSAVGGSVNQRVKNATDAFIAALTQEATDRRTYVQNYAYSKEGVNAAISAQASVTRAEFREYGDLAADYAINTSRAYVLSYTYTAADIRSAIAASEQTLRAEFSGGPGGGPNYATQAYVQNYAYSIAQADGAIAAQTADLRTTVGNNTAAINQSATTLNGLSAQVFTKIDINGYVTGYGLSSSAATGTPTSAFIVRAEQFQVVAPNGVPQPMFSIKQDGNRSVAVFSGELKIGPGGAVLNRDPNFTDISGSWNATANVIFGTNAGGNGPASTYLGIGPSASVITSSKEMISVDPTKTYVLAASLYQDPGFNQQCILLIDFFDNLGNRLATNWGDANFSGYTLVVNPPAGTWTTYRGGVFGANTLNGHTIPAGTKTCRIGASLNSINTLQSGVMAVTGLRLEEVIDGTSIQDGVIKTNHLDIATGGSIHSAQTGFDQGDGFWLEGEGRGHGARMSIGRQFGRKIIMDPANNRLELVDPQLSSPMTVSVSPSFYNIIRNANQQFNDAYAGSYTASAANAGPNLSYQWAVSSENSAVTANMDSPRSQQCTVSVSGKLFADQEVNVAVYCVVTDLDTRVSRAAGASINVQTQSF